MPSLQPSKIEVTPGDWENLIRQLNRLISDIYERLDYIEGVDNKQFIAAGDNSITITGSTPQQLAVKRKTDYGIELDSDGLKLNKQAHIADASTSHTITDPADSPANADILRDDLVANTIPDIETKLNALGAKINFILTALEALKALASS